MKICTVILQHPNAGDKPMYMTVHVDGLKEVVAGRASGYGYSKETHLLQTLIQRLVDVWGINLEDFTYSPYVKTSVDGKPYIVHNTYDLAYPFETLGMRCQVVRHYSPRGALLSTAMTIVKA